MKAPKPPHKLGQRIALKLLDIAASWPFIAVQTALLVWAGYHISKGDRDYDVSIWTLYLDNTIIIATVILSKFSARQTLYIQYLAENHATAVEHIIRLLKIVVKLLWKHRHQCKSQH